VEEIVRRAHRLIHDEDHHAEAAAGTDVYKDDRAGERIAASVTNLIGGSAPLADLPDELGSSTGAGWSASTARRPMSEPATAEQERIQRVPGR
jgi:hypothetical protein